MRRFHLSHARFVILYSALLFGICNALNIDKLARWFYANDRLDYLALSAYLLAGLCLLIVVLALLAHRWTIKPLAVILTILSAAAAYFISKYNVAIDSSMVLNTVHTDATEVGQLLSSRMVPYVVFLMVLPVLVILSINITFRPAGGYLLDSLKLISIGLLIAHCLPVLQLQGHSSGRKHVEQVHRLFTRANQRHFEFHQCACQVAQAIPGAAGGRNPRYPVAYRHRAIWWSCSR